nr:hypothetical protein [Micromonospora sp. DSM 115978]
MAIATVAVALLVSITLWFRWGDDPSRQSPSCLSPVGQPAGAAAPASDAPGGGGLSVTEKGFTQVGPDGQTVSLGALLENTSARIAYRTRISFRVIDAGGASAVPANSGTFLVQEIPVILPGERVGAGSWTYVRDDPSGRPVTVSAFEVDIGATTWLPSEENPDSFAPVGAQHRRTERSSVEPQTGTVEYQVASPYCQALTSRGVAVVFRDAGGSMIGGSFELDNPRLRCQPGASTESAGVARSLPPNADHGQTAIYPYCDPAPANSSPAGATDAVNYRS